MHIAETGRSFLSGITHSAEAIFTEHAIESTSIYQVAQNALTGIKNIYTDPAYLGIIGFSSALNGLFNFMPMYTPFILTDKRSYEEMHKEDPVNARILKKLTTAVHEQAKMMGASCADKINVRFGIQNQAQGCPYSLGGPLLVISKTEAPKLFSKTGELTDTGQRIIGHELTHILEYHCIWGLPSRIMNIAITCGLFFAMVSLIPTGIPLVVKIVASPLLLIFKYTLYKVRSVTAGFITGPMDRYFEWRADRGAVHYMTDHKRAIKIARAGQEYFKAKASANLITRQDSIAKGGFSGIWNRLHITDQGENRLDFMHPGYMQRIAGFKEDEKYLLAHSPLRAVS